MTLQKLAPASDVPPYEQLRTWSAGTIADGGLDHRLAGRAAR